MRGFLPIARWSLVLGLVGVLVGSGPATGRARLDRSGVDRPDDVGGPQIHAIYVVPADGEDRQSDVNGGVAEYVAHWTNWLADQAGDRTFRIDTYQGQVDVSFLRLAETTAAMGALGFGSFGAIVAELRAAGFVRADKRYAVYYGGPYPGPFAGLGGQVSGSGYAIAFGVNPQPTDATLDLGTLHELMHSLGFVPRCAPHFTTDNPGHVNDDPHDLMYSGWREPIVLDAGHDDYFEAHIPGCADLSDSPYLVSFPHHTISIAVQGDGTVKVSQGGSSCGANSSCNVSVRAGSTVYLDHVGGTSGPGSHFVGWGGDCSGAGTEVCSLVVSRDMTVTARFAANPALSLQVRGQGSVRILAPYVGNNTICTKSCKLHFGPGTQLLLIPTPASGYAFARWTGACSGKRRCSLTLNRATAVVATFTKK